MRGKKWRIFLLVVFLLLIGIFAYLFSLPPDDSAPLNRDLKISAWMGVTWSMDVHPTTEIEQLADDLIRYGVDEIYVYASYLKAGDFFNPTYDHAGEFITNLKQFAPDIQILAWIGVPISITQPDGTFIANRLESPDIRQMIAQFSVMAVEELGFDGIHLNAELIPDGDEAYLLTLEAIREALPEGTFFSTTAHALRLNKQVTASPYPTIVHHASPDYVRDIAEFVDQIAIMTYDSGLSFPRDYRDWMAYQVEMSETALMDHPVEIMIGLPTSEEWTPSHQTQAETVHASVQGFRAGYDGRADGVAIYPYWDTSADEWEIIVSGLE